MEFNTDFCCPLCNRLHAIRKCSRFLVMEVEQKLRIVAQYSLCYNCLAQSHTRDQCISIDRCRRCMQDHNSLLHPTPEDRIWVKMMAFVRITAHRDDTEYSTHALIDPTAARSSITLKEAQRVRCKIMDGRTNITVFHGYEEVFRFIDVECVVEDKKYGYSPVVDVDPHIYGKKNISASRYWNIRHKYHLILGADAAGKILKGPAKGKAGQLFVQETIFGWAYFGEAKKREN